MALFTTAELNQIRLDVQTIIRDTSINTSLKYRQYTGQDYYDPKEQVYEQTMYTDWSSVSAVKGLVTKNEPNRPTGVEIGDSKFIIMQSAVSNTLSVSDLIVESSTTYAIKKVGYDDLGIVYILYVESV